MNDYTYTFNRMLSQYYYNKIISDSKFDCFLESVKEDNNLEKLDSNYTEKLTDVTNNKDNKKVISTGLLYSSLLILLGTGLIHFSDLEELFEILSNPTKMTRQQVNFFIAHLCLLSGKIIKSIYTGKYKEKFMKYYFEFKDIYNEVKKYN